MKRLKTIVVEDERLPRLALLQKLTDFAGQVEVVDACDSYETALKSIVSHKPDLLLLDIQLNGRDSIELLHELREQMPLPHIIFTTAYDDRQYLMSAIKIQATDYLLKPVSKQELALAINKVIHDITPFGKTSTLRTSKGVIQIANADIAYIKAARNYAAMVGFQCDEMLLDNIYTLERTLDEDFVRIDRSTIVNIKTIYQINKRQCSCTFKSKDGKELVLKLSKVGLSHILGSS